MARSESRLVLPLLATGSEHCTAAAAAAAVQDGGGCGFHR